MRTLDFLHDLTDEYRVKTTLSGLKYDGVVPCDHILTNSAIKVDHFIVHHFIVHPDLVSDHLALSADFEIEQ